jgi:hypothetical protein
MPGSIMLSGISVSRFCMAGLPARHGWGQKSPDFCAATQCINTKSTILL